MKMEYPITRVFLLPIHFNLITVVNFFLKNLIVIIVISGLWACGKDKRSETVYFSDHSSLDYMAFDSVHFLQDFPEIHVLGKGKPVNQEMIGMWSFEIEDSLLFVSTMNSFKMWKTYKLPDMEFYGGFLNIGEGPAELSGSVNVSDKVQYEFSDSKNSVIIYDFKRGRLLDLDLDQSRKLGRDSVRLFDHNPPSFLFDILVFDSTSYFMRQPENLETELNRYFDSAGVLTSRKVFEELNNSKVSQSLNLPIISSMTRSKSDSETIVEMYFRLNYFNLYSLDGSLKKTICIENQMDKISSIEALEQIERKYRFSDVRVYDDYFALLHLNEVELDFSTERKSKPEILFFDWDGNPLAKIISKEFFTAFDLDLNNQVVYTFDSETDRFRLHEVPDFTF